MLSHAFLLGGAATLAMGAALPSAPQSEKLTMRVPQTVSRPALVGPLAMSKTYNKYGKSNSMPADVKAAAAAAQTGHVVAQDQPYDEEYLCSVTVGSTVMNLDFDTGSSDLWVFSTLQPSSQTSGHTLYPLSGTRESGETWNIGYGDGSGASGVVYADKVNIGGVTVTSQAVEAATSVSSEFVSSPGDGLVGLAFDNINTCTPNTCATFMNNAGPTLQSNLFTATLKKGTNGEYDFGYIDTTKYTGALTYSSINTANGFWQFTIGGYSVGSAAETTSSTSVIADTGTTLIYLPSAIVKAYYKQVSGATYSSSQGAYVFPCSSTLPNFSVYTGSAKHTVPGSYLSYQPLGNGQCYGAIQLNTGLGGLSILGDSFLKSQFVVFDTGNTRIGLAQQAGIPSS